MNSESRTSEQHADWCNSLIIGTQARPVGRCDCGASDQRHIENRESRLPAGEQEANRPELYYLQNKGYCGNSLVWWRQGRSGYTSDIKQAHVFTKAEAFEQAKVRPTEDFPWRKEYIDAHLQHHVNSETVSRKDSGAV